MSTTIRYTSTDLASLPDDGRRYEIIDGELYVSKQPRYQHQHCCGRIYKFLDNWIDGGGHGRAVMAPGLIFSDDNDVVPDVVWLSAERLQATLRADGHFHGAPEIAIEAVSPGPANSVRDRETKRELYGRRGVNEYWILDWAAKTVEVYERREQALELARTLSIDDELTSPLLAGFRCPVRNLFDIPTP
jgi:Uma2 family endonuclease